jgi:hypothetical protein
MPAVWAEHLVGWLIPPAVREQVLGDLRERYRSLSQYLIDGLGVVSYVVWCRIRRTSDARVVFLEAFCLYVPLVVAAWVTDRELLMPERLGFVRLGGMALAGLVAMRLSDAYARPGNFWEMRAVRREPDRSCG